MGSLSYDGGDDDGDDYGGDDRGGGCNYDIDDDITDSPRQPDIVSLDSTTEGGELIYFSLW